MTQEDIIQQYRDLEKLRQLQSNDMYKEKVNQFDLSMAEAVIDEDDPAQMMVKDLIKNALVGRSTHYSVTSSSFTSTSTVSTMKKDPPPLPPPPPKGRSRILAVSDARKPDVGKHDTRKPVS
jgi:hypothetical protein